ncbi:hypothetical protein [Streptomyces sp. NPDC001307]|uniref:hypothetical protein n=1 Tax=Streptomyces sp. NPDC001307 TaxID=3364560 RepID=UPI00367F959E
MQRALRAEPVFDEQWLIAAGRRMKITWWRDGFSRYRRVCDLPLWQPAGMPLELREHAGRHYAIQFHYALPDDAWALELSEAEAAPAAWAEIPHAETYLPSRALLVAFVPDEDPNLEPTVHVHSHDEHVIPYEIMRWFMERIADQVERCRAALVEEDGQTAR